MTRPADTNHDITDRPDAARVRSITSLLQLAEGKTVKNRLHVDIHGGPGGLDALVERLESLGATRVREEDQGLAGHWWVLRDPEGNEFCATGY